MKHCYKPHRFTRAAFIDFEEWNDTIEEVQKCRERLSKVAEKLDQGKL
jgi:hypothetical protein